MLNPLNLVTAPFTDPGIENWLVLFMLLVSVGLIAIAVERLAVLLLLRMSVARAGRVVTAARTEGLSEAKAAADKVGGPVGRVLGAGLSRELGEVRGEALMAMAREQKRLGGAMRARTWILATAGALMPFVGLFGTVLGVMASFESIGESGQGGFAVVSVGISQALVATAVGIAVALEGVVLFNVLQNTMQRLARDLALMVDELSEIILVERGSDAGDA